MSGPLISIVVQGAHRVMQPGDLLSGQLQIDSVGPDEVQSVEVSVLWYTEGKGDEDLGVSHFRRYTPEDGSEIPLCELRDFSTTLPNSPLSYDGLILKIRWCVRVRVFLPRGRQAVAEQAFQLGNVPGAVVTIPT